MESARRVESLRYLQQIAEKVKYGGAMVKTEVVSGKPAESLAEYGEKNGIDLIVVATHGRSGVSRWV